jgi:hypothetical protein
VARCRRRNRRTSLDRRCLRLCLLAPPRRRLVVPGLALVLVLVLRWLRRTASASASEPEAD